MIKSILRKIKKILISNYYKTMWKKYNKHNYTSINIPVPHNVAQIGNSTYGKLNIHYYKTDCEHLTIGNFCSIADNVHFFLGGEHNYHNISTFPFKNYIFKNKIKESISKGPIIIGDDVWIGFGTTILSGVKIGQGSVIGANSIVTKDIPPYSIYAGNRIIKRRFSNKIIKKLTNIDYSKVNIKQMEDKLQYLYNEVTEKNIDEIINALFGEGDHK